jgi:hypothetical protein
VVECWWFLLVGCDGGIEMLRRLGWILGETGDSIETPTGNFFY